MYALVRFTDETKTRIVDIDDIKRFDEKLIDKQKFLVKFTDGQWYPAQVVVVKETIKELEDFQKKRVPFKNRDLLLSAVESESESDSFYVPKKKEEKKSAFQVKDKKIKEKEKKAIEQDILKKFDEKQGSKIYPGSCANRSSVSLSVPFEALGRDFIKPPDSESCHSCISSETEIQNLKRQLEDLKIQNRDLLDLNFGLQREVIGHFEKLNLTNKAEVAQVDVGCKVDDQVHLGRGVYIPAQSYNDAWFRSVSGSQFVKNIALYVFGSTTLVNSSVTGRSSNHINKGKVKPALDGTKLAAIEDIYKHYLKLKDPEKNVKNELRMIKTYIGSKIGDLVRLEQRRKKKPEKRTEDVGNENTKQSANQSDGDIESEDKGTEIKDKDDNTDSDPESDVHSDVQQD